nr:hypothetical protein 34 [bacterium]
MASKLPFALPRVITPVNNKSATENQPAVYPGPNTGWTSWDSGSGEFWIQEQSWKNDAKLQCSGDPTSTSNAVVKLNTGANHDCNCFWGSNSPEKCTERNVRGLYMRIYTNGAKFQPRISCAALRYYDLSNGRYYNYGLARDKVGTLCVHSSGTWPYFGTDSTNYWYGVALTTSLYGDENSAHNTNRVWVGCLFHYESTWKTGSAVDCNVYINRLRPIFDAGREPNPVYNNRHRVWGVSPK